MTHNLREVFTARRTVDSPVPNWASGFADWMHERLAAGDTRAVLGAIEAGPEGRRNHPTPDHLLPLHAALGAGGEGAAATRQRVTAAEGTASGSAPSRA